jgi:hypothetical protein
MLTSHSQAVLADDTVLNAQAINPVHSVADSTPYPSTRPRRSQASRGWTGMTYSPSNFSSFGIVETRFRAMFRLACMAATCSPRLLNVATSTASSILSRQFAGLPADSHAYPPTRRGTPSSPPPTPSSTPPPPAPALRRLGAASRPRRTGAVMSASRRSEATR